MIPIFDLVSQQYKAFAYEQKCKRNPITMKEALWTTINHTLDDTGCSFTNISIDNIQNMAPNTNIQTSPFVLADSKEGKVSTPEQGDLTVDLDWIDEYQQIVPSRFWVVVFARSKILFLFSHRPCTNWMAIYIKWGTSKMAASMILILRSDWIMGIYSSIEVQIYARKYNLVILYLCQYRCLAQNKFSVFVKIQPTLCYAAIQLRRVDSSLIIGMLLICKSTLEPTNNA